MSKKLYLIVFSSLLCIWIVSGCKTKEGCGLEEKYAPDMESKGGKSNLFGKKQTKRKG
jgi:predicted small secreted protein